MATSTRSQGDRFIAAFNDIEQRFRRDLRRDEFARFAEMARVYAAKHHLRSAQLDALLAFRPHHHGSGGHLPSDSCQTRAGSGASADRHRGRQARGQAAPHDHQQRYVGTIRSARDRDHRTKLRHLIKQSA